ASPSEIAAISGMGFRDSAFGRCQDALELAERVERAFRVHRAVTAEGNGERTAGNSQRPPDVGVPDLVEDLDGDERVAPESGDHRLEAVTEATAVGGEDRERELCARGTVELLGEPDTFAERRPLVGDFQRRLRRQ